MKKDNDYADDSCLANSDVDCGYLQQIVTDSMDECIRQDDIPIDKLKCMKLIINETSQFNLMKGFAEKKQPSIAIVSSQQQG